MLMTFLVGGLMLIALWNAFTFKLNSKTHAILVEEISRLQKADSIGGCLLYTSPGPRDRG